MPEKNYEFRRRLNEVHRPDRRNPRLLPERAELVLDDSWRIVVSETASNFLVRVAQDLRDYLFTSMNLSLRLMRAKGAEVLAEASPHVIFVGTGEDFNDGFAKGLEVKRSYRVLCKRDSVQVCGFDDRGAAQACYYLEDLMNLREAPFLELCDQVRAPVFQPRMVHSGWGIDLFPDPHLNAIAHSGMDAILVFVKGPNLTTNGHLDINDLIERAAAFGLDVYLYSYLRSSVHPADPEAEAFYEGTYGALMRAHPGARGVVFVGESCGFPSRDDRTKGRTRHCPIPPGGENDSRPFPGWWPCSDYPEWLEMVKGIIRRYNATADVVFWTYNWGWAPEKERLELIQSLPRDISLQATFEMFENIERKEGITTRCVDYTTSFPGPGKYFSSEARAAAQRGIPLYTMSNTAGLSWDIGVIPYQPIPFQWKRRYDGLLKAHEDWGLCGLMESHHYGWWPSFVSDLAKWSYWSPAIDYEAMVERIARRDFGADAAIPVVEAWKLWSDAWQDYVPTNEDQYGPFRVGPAYPLVFMEEDVDFPSADYAHFGARILHTLYRSHAPADVETEILLLSRMASKWKDGLLLLERAMGVVSDKKFRCMADMLRLGQFIFCCLRTTINVKGWYLQNRIVLDSEQSVEARLAALEQMVELAQKETENAEAAMPLVLEDSRLGWEPSMEYMCDAAHLKWKLDQVRNVLENQIPSQRELLTGTL